MKHEECISLPCEIVQDLLPSYADTITCGATNSVVNAHLEQCEACRTALATMQTPVEDSVFPATNDADHRGVNFLKKIKQKTVRKIIVAAVGAVFLCFFLFLTLSEVQHPFTPTFETYQLADGRLYFEMTVYGKEADIESISFYQEDTVTNGATHDIHMGYSLLSLLSADDTYKSKTYCFPPLSIDDGLETLQYSCGKTIYTIWQKDHVVPAATAEIEQEMAKNNVGTLVFWSRYELA